MVFRPWCAFGVVNNVLFVGSGLVAVVWGRASSCVGCNPSLRDSLKLIGVDQLTSLGLLVPLHTMAAWAFHMFH